MYKKLLAGALAASLLVAALSTSAYAGTWHQGRGENSGRWWYKYDDGSYASDCTLAIDGTSYSFDKDGWMIDTPAGAVTVVSAPAVSSGNDTGTSLVTEASKYIGEGVVPYVNGGRSLSGTDCSGFLHIIYGLYGVDLPYTPTDIYAMCTKIPESELRPGDFIFFTKNGGASISHVGIYAGDGYMIHQTNRARNGVYKDLISNMYLDGVTSYYGAGTVLR